MPQRAYRSLLLFTLFSTLHKVTQIEPDKLVSRIRIKSLNRYTEEALTQLEAIWQQRYTYLSSRQQL